MNTKLKKTQQHFILSGVVDWPSWLSKKDSLISVRREFEGVIKEEVLLSSHHLRYDLKIQEALGDLVVEVFNSHGQILARGKAKASKPWNTTDFKAGFQEPKGLFTPT